MYAQTAVEVAKGKGVPYVDMYNSIMGVKDWDVSHTVDGFYYQQHALGFGTPHDAGGGKAHLLTVLALWQLTAQAVAVLDFQQVPDKRLHRPAAAPTHPPNQPPAAACVFAVSQPSPIHAPAIEQLSELQLSVDRSR